MKDAIGADPKTKLSPWTIGEVRDAWAEYDRLGRTHEGYADTAAAHLAHTIQETLW
ncbi:hypothetical protein [Bifidobacterium moukalabense]|uniref:hypothetical protein n=1 Tax=Bifidobacterium moukalabense TaxID=1333651 RepID=UPI001484E6B6|nr:hypothetical protein [Bifidobacterium moukalabense]